jgi:lysophospholipase L1-like esterase
MSVARLAAVVMALILAAAGRPAQAQLRCGSFFTEHPVAAPQARVDFWAVSSFQRINLQVKTLPYKVLFFGDSIIERWLLPLWDAKPVWDANMPQRGVLNAAVSGDRTENLRWRLENGNLDGPPPKGVILLIGTNDLGHGRSPQEAAEGIRVTLMRLHDQLPSTRILLLGLTPRAASPDDPMRHAVTDVNKLIQTCAGDGITYADIGGVLLEKDGTLSAAVSPDQLHFSGLGYQRLVPRLDALIDQLEK